MPGSSTICLYCMGTQRVDSICITPLPISGNYAPLGTVVQLGVIRTVDVFETFVSEVLEHIFRVHSCYRRFALQFLWLYFTLIQDPFSIKTAMLGISKVRR